MVTSQRRLTSLTLSLALLGTLFVGVPAQRVAAVGDPIYRIAVIAKGTAATSTNWGAWTTTYTITFP